MKNTKSQQRVYVRPTAQSTGADINNYYKKSGLVPKPTIASRIYHVKVIS
jgi:hypothetical protein